MEQLWSPWRSAYVQQQSNTAAHACFLCECARVATYLPDNLVVAGTASTIVVMNRFPYNAGHLLVAPRGHHGDLATLDADIAADIMRMTQRSLRVMQNVMEPHGCNVGINLGIDAGAGVPGHLHVHLVPRWRGDTNFMPVLADIRMVGIRLEDLWKRYVDAFASEAP